MLVVETVVAEAAVAVFHQLRAHERRAYARRRHVVGGHELVERHDDLRRDARTAENFERALVHVVALFQKKERRVRELCYGDLRSLSRYAQAVEVVRAYASLRKAAVCRKGARHGEDYLLLADRGAFIGVRGPFLDGDAYVYRLGLEAVR